MTFEDAYNYMKNGTLMRQVINKINGIDFNASDDRHMFGDIYEKILKDLQSRRQRRRVLHPARRHPVHRRAGQSPHSARPSSTPPAAPAASSPAPSSTCASRPRPRPTSARIQDCFAGIEKKHLPHLLCMTNMLLHGIDVPSNVRHDNTLARPLRDWGPKERVDVIVTNPPFGGMEEDGIETNFPAEFRTRETADLFLVLLMKLLKPGGRAGARAARRHALRRRRQDPHQGSAAHRVQPAHHRPPAQRRLQPLHRHPDQPALLHQGRSRPPTSGTTSTPIRPAPRATTRASPSASRSSRPRSAGGAERRLTARVENEQAWRVSIDQIKAGNYNLDLKNPHNPDNGPGDVDHLLPEYEKLLAQIAETRAALKAQLQEALSR